MAKNGNCKILILLIHLEKDGPPGEIRTPDTQVRSLVLYPAELRADSCLRMQKQDAQYRQSDASMPALPEWFILYKCTVLRSELTNASLL